MHEYGLTQGIIDIAVTSAAQNGASKVLKVNVKAGRMMSLVEDSMQFYFEFLTKNTCAEGATLEVEHVPIVIRCSSCGEGSEVDEFGIYSCPKCASPLVELISGKEFLVDSIEIE